jgi:saccharopine dehydrogenase-like NADP-dependent oxidoreductase
MVKIALAGGSGDVASEIIEVLVATKKHDIVILSRNVSLQVLLHNKVR